MKLILYVLICLTAVGCAATVAKYDVCLGFCAVLDVDKKETPKHVTEALELNGIR